MSLPVNSTACFANALLALLCSSELLAFSPARPKQHEVFSPNHRFVLDVNPASKEQRVYASGDRSKELWSLTEEVWQEQFYVADDGESVAIVYGCFTTVEPPVGLAVRFVGREGKRNSYSTEQLCLAPYTTTQVVGPIGDKWRRWLHRLWQQGPELLLTTVDGHEYRFSLATGRVVGHRLVDPMPMDEGYVAWQNTKLVFALLVTAGCTCALWFFIRRRIRRSRVNLSAAPQPLS